MKKILESFCAECAVLAASRGARSIFIVGILFYSLPARIFMRSRRICRFLPWIRMAAPAAASCCAVWMPRKGYACIAMPICGRAIWWGHRGAEGS